MADSDETDAPSNNGASTPPNVYVIIATDTPTPAGLALGLVIETHPVAVFADETEALRRVGYLNEFALRSTPTYFTVTYTVVAHAPIPF